MSDSEGTSRPPTGSASSSSSGAAGSSSGSPRRSPTNPPPGTTIWTAPQSYENPTAPRQPPQPNLLGPDAAFGAGAADASDRAQAQGEGALARERRRQATYFRRITGNAPPAPSRPSYAPAGSSPAAAGSGISAAARRPGLLARSSSLLTIVLGAGLGGWMLLFADFGEKEHVFSPLRRAVFSSPLLSITKEQEQWLSGGFKMRHSGPAPGMLAPGGGGGSGSSSSSNGSPSSSEATAGAGSGADSGARLR